MGRAKYSVNNRRNRKVTSQERIPGSQGLRQSMNNAGGYAFKVDSFEHLKRFLILGTEAGTYYVHKTTLDKQCINTLVVCLRKDYKKTIDLIIEVSNKGLAPKNDPAIFALAVACAMKKAPVGVGFGDKTAAACRDYARSNIGKVCRIPSHLFSFIEYYLSVGGGWNAGMRKAISYWYNKPIDKITMQAIKYQSREGWSNRDVLRLVHPTPRSKEHDALFRWIVAGKDHRGRKVLPKFSHQSTRIYDGFTPEDIPTQLKAYEWCKELQPTEPRYKEKLVNYIQKYRLTREMIPTEGLKYPEVWEALIQEMPMTALIRNLGNLGKAGLLDLGSDTINFVERVVLDEENLKRARVHPLQIYNALKTYAQGHGVRGKGAWTVNKRVCEMLDDAFYLAFDNGLEPTNRRILHSVDISGSMKGSFAGKDRLMSVQEGAAIMMLASLYQEANAYTTVFHTDCYPVNIRRGMPVDIAVDHINKAGNGGTAVSAPIAYALGNLHKDSKTGARRYGGFYYRTTDCRREGPPIEVDAFVLYTDSETWADYNGHPQQLLDQYRKEVNPNAKAIVVSMTATDFTVADPEDPQVLQLCGFDVSVPKVVNSFLTE